MEAPSPVVLPVVLPDLPRLADRTRELVAGVRERAQTPRTRSGKRTCFLTMEDHTGLLDVVLFSDTLARIGDTIVKNRAYVVDGTLQNNAERGIAVETAGLAGRIFQRGG